MSETFRFPEWKMMACDSLSKSRSVVVLQLETRQPAVSNGLEPKPKSKLALPWYFVQNKMIFVSLSLSAARYGNLKKKEIGIRTFFGGEFLKNIQFCLPVLVVWFPLVSEKSKKKVMIWLICFMNLNFIPLVPNYEKCSEIPNRFRHGRGIRYWIWVQLNRDTLMMRLRHSILNFWSNSTGGCSNIDWTVDY